MAPEDMTPTSSAATPITSAAGKQDRPKRKTPAPTSSAAANSEKGKKRKAKTTTAAAAAAAACSDGYRTLVVIEYCEESKSYKKKAKRVKKGLEKAIPGVNVVVNPEPPRKGFFEIRDENDEPLFTLMHMNGVLNALDVDNLVSDIVDYIKRFGCNNW
ncbi:hypothetical protein ACP275_05G103300 [Erythranthe tilingii]